MSPALTYSGWCKPYTKSVTLREAVDQESNCGGQECVRLTVLLLRDASPIDANVSKTNFNVRAVVIVVLCTKNTLPFYTNMLLS